VSTPAVADDPLVVDAAKGIEGASPVTSALASAVLPYPGLRPFERHEADIFFGRETQVDAMIDRLGRHRLLVVTGSSGCGKSSLVRAGLLEALETGLFAKAGPGWRFATLRPGSQPMTELARSLLLALDAPRALDDVALRRAGLERGPLSLIEELRERPLPDGCNLLILVDQFEELFRYRSLAGREEAEAFVALLLASAAQLQAPIYVVLTMRSDFLGRCAEFDGLAEAVSDAQHLCPRLSRDQIRSAIEGPAEVFGGKVEPRLATRIVNDMGTDPDQLPLMQHALMRLWEKAQRRDSRTPELRLEDYEAEGGIKGSLSRHADEILAEIARDFPERAETARRLFCLLVEGEGENAVRRLTTVAEAIDVTGKPLGEIAAVADPFRAPGRSLLMPPVEWPLDRDRFLDISHESLIRQWQTLKDWVRAETGSAEQYREIERRARRWAERSAGFLDGIDLDLGLAWREHAHPTAGWAARYGSDFDLAIRFLNDSRSERDAIEARRLEQERRVIAAEEAVARQQEEVKRQQAEAEAEGRRIALEAAEERAFAASRLARRTCIGLIAMSVLLIITAGLAWWGFGIAREAERLRTVTEAALAETEIQRVKADNQKVIAEDAAREAEGQRMAAVAAARMAEHRLRAAQLNQSRFLTEKSQGQLHDGEPDLATLTALAALPADMGAPGGRPVWFPAVSALADIRSDLQRMALRGHARSVQSAAFGPDGARVVTGSADKTARLWDAQTGAALAVLEGHTYTIYSAAFSPDGARVVTGSADKTARLWDAQTGAALAVLEGHTDAVNSAAFSPDGARIMTASDDKTARVWDAKTGSSITVLQGHAGAVFSAAFSRHGDRIVTASADNKARLWNANTGKSLAVLRGHRDSVNSAAFSADGTRIVTASADWTARVWDAKTGTSLAVLQGHAQRVTSAAFSPDGARIVTGSSDHSARLWDAKTGASLAVLQGHTESVNSAAFSPDGAWVVTASDDNSARLWDAKTGASLAVLQGHTDAVNSAAFSPDGARVITASDDKTARLWDAATPASVTLLQGHSSSVSSAAFSPDGARIVTGSFDKTARLWDAQTGASLTVLQGHTESVNGAAFSPDGARIVTGSGDGTPRLWDAKTGALLAVLQGHTESVNSAAFSLDGARIVTASWDNTARLWDAKTGASLTVLQGHTDTIYSAAFSPDGARVVTGSADKTARLWDAKTGASLAVLQGHTSWVWDTSFSPDGARIVTASDDKTARLWDAKTGASLTVLQGHAGSVYTAGFSPDGARVVTASADKTARLWDAETGAALAVLQGHAGAVFSAAFSRYGDRIVTASADQTARLWEVWPLLTADAVVYAHITALRGLSKDERSSLLLTEAESGSGQEPPTVSSDNPGTKCDQLAGDPFDPRKRAAGVVFDAIDAEEAISACRAAVQATPDEPRFGYQLGRALYRADKRDEAVALIRGATENGDAAAQHTLGDLYKNGIGVAKDDAQALRLYRQSAEGGYVLAFSDEGLLFWDGIGTKVDHTEAVNWFKRGADRGDPFSHRKLAELYEIGGDQLPQDLEKALFHHAIETRLFEAVDNASEAAIACARRGSLARALPPETAVRVAREAAAWQPNGSETPAH
jgi:WD40 repeat protein